MNKHEKFLMNELSENVDGFDAMVGRGKDNPAFIAQFDLQLLTKYYTLNGGTYTEIAAGSLTAGLQNDLPFFLFGQSDFQAGYKRLKSQFQINSNWTYGRPWIQGHEVNTELALDATVLGGLENGDLVIPFTSALPGGGTTTLALHIVRCPQVAMGSLLAATSSDTFVIDGVRYVLDNSALTGQYSRAINVIHQSIFGKFKSDTFTPNAYKSAEQFQDGIIDIPITDGIDKHSALAFNNLYTNVSQSLSIFVRNVTKVSAEIVSAELN